jgi:hypothetical protein
MSSTKQQLNSDLYHVLGKGEVWKQKEGIRYLALSNSYILTSGMCSGKERSGSRKRELDI